jgi:hypothetical protein
MNMNKRILMKRDQDGLAKGPWNPEFHYSRSILQICGARIG